METSGEEPSEIQRGVSGHVDGRALGPTIDRLIASTTGDVALEDALELVIQSSHELFALAGTGLMIFDDLDVLGYVAAGDARAHLLEKVQEQAAQGPCVDAAVYGHIVESEDASGDERWPELARGLRGQGVRGVLGVPVRLSATVVGSLNVYSEDQHAWDVSRRGSHAELRIATAQ